MPPVLVSCRVTADLSAVDYFWVNSITASQ